ncbi:MAG TPA: hypothetical protein VKF61_06485 [Candidatus Polarisedimenticolia bacterium]|nr:hypothetical protein [Candidatus Polarisedimenticolia bacterium]
MAALGAAVDIIMDARWLVETEIKSSGTLTFYRGALVSIALGTGTAKLSPADGDEFYGICLEPKSAVSGTLIRVAIRGLFLIANTAFTDANLNKLFAQAGGGTDNPADLILQTTGTAGAAGRLVAVKTSGTSGWLDISDRSTVANA